LRFAKGNRVLTFVRCLLNAPEHSLQSMKKRRFSRVVSPDKKVNTLETDVITLETLEVLNMKRLYHRAVSYYLFYKRNGLRWDEPNNHRISQRVYFDPRVVAFLPAKASGW
jgi:hypothetical protein